MPDNTKPRFTNYQIRVLRALRACPMTATEGAEMGMPGFNESAKRLAAAGLVYAEELPGGGDSNPSTRYHLTAAGLQACPPRNPASTRPRRHPTPGPNVRGPSFQPVDTRRSLWTDL
jgi:hypothetical protein